MNETTKSPSSCCDDEDEAMSDDACGFSDSEDSCCQNLSYKMQKEETLQVQNAVYISISELFILPQYFLTHLSAFTIPVEPVFQDDPPEKLSGKSILVFIGIARI